MSEKIISPGVFTRENDVSFLSQGIGNIGAAIIGPFKKGPVFLPTIVNTQSEFENIFGTPDGSYYTGYTVQNYLREAGSVSIVRVGHKGGYIHKHPLAIQISGSQGTRIISTLFATNPSQSPIGFNGSAITSSVGSPKFSLTVSGSSAVSSSIKLSDPNDVISVYGTSPYGSKSTYVYNYFENTANIQVALGSGSISLIDMPDQEFTDDCVHASTPWVKSQDDGNGNRSNLFRFHTLGAGTIYNKEYKIGISNIKVIGDYPSFTVIVRSFSDTDRRPVILETFNNVNLNPSSANHISRRIGDLNTTIDSTGKMTITGDFKNSSKYIRVEVASEGTYPANSVPFGHGAYLNPIILNGQSANYVPPVIYSSGSSTNISSNSSTFSGIDLETISIKVDNNNYLAPLPKGVTSGINTTFALDTISDIASGSSSDSPDYLSKRQFIIGFQSGFDGIDPSVKINLGSSIDEKNSQGFDLSSSTSSGSVAYIQAINSISNPDDFDINLVSVPGIIRMHHPYVFDKVVDMVESRQDAFFIGDVVGPQNTIEDAITQGAAVDSNYVGTYYPWVKTIDVNTNKLTSVPPSVLMPGIYASNDNIAAEWWAPAGLNRGGIVGAVSVLNRLTHSERDTLYEGKINPIASFPGEGIVAFGQKTLQTNPSALDRINVRRLLIKVKKYVASISRYMVFEQNSSTTRNKFVNIVNPYLEGIQQRQGLYTFKVVMDETNNTPDVIDRNLLVGQLFLQPTRTAEFIVLDFSIMPTGATFSS